MVDISKILEIIKDPDLKLKINDLYSENLILKEENFKLKKEVEILKNNEETNEKLIHKDNHYFIKKDQSEDGPFCTKCWDSEKKLIRIHDHGVRSGLNYFECPNCKTSTTTGKYISPNSSRNNWGLY